MNQIIDILARKEVRQALYGLAIFSAGVAVGIAYESSSGHIRFEIEEEPEEENPQLELPFTDPPERVVISSEDFVNRIIRDEAAEAEYIPEVLAEKRGAEPVDQNIFDLADGWDWVVENRNREENPNEPYVITVEEYIDQESGFHQETLIYYEGDDILCTETNHEPIYDYATVVGWLRFGHGSKDANLFYVRNTERRAEYEIRLMHGKYTEEVLGLKYETEAEQQELKHSHRPQKFRLE